MKKSFKRTLAKGLSVVMAFSMLAITPADDADAAKASKPKMAKKSYSVTVGKKVTVKISSKKKVKKTTWSLSKKDKKKISLSKKKAKSVVVKGKKAKTTATLKAKVKVGKKNYKLSVKVKVKAKKVTPKVTAKPTVKPTQKPNNNVNKATPTPATKATEAPVSTLKNGEKVDESQTYHVALTELNETTFTCAAKRPEDADPIADGTLYNRDGSVSFTSLKEYNSGVSYYINPCTSEDDVVDISETRGDGYTGFQNGTKDMFDYDYIRIKLKSDNEMNFRTYNGNDQLESAGFPGSSTSETYEGGWVGPTDDYMESDGGTGQKVKDAYVTRTVFIPISSLMDKGCDPSGLTAIAMCPQRDGVEVTIYAIDFVKVQRTNKVENITVTADKTELANGKVAKCTTAITPDNATRKTVKWTSSDESLAKVNFKGAVTAAAEGKGEVTITATATDGSNVSGSVKIKIGETANAKPAKNVNVALNAAGVVGKTNPGSGDSVAATQTATSIEFMADKNMAFVDFSAYLTANKIDLSDYATVSVAYRVVGSDGDVVKTNSEATYGKIALVESSKLNGYDSGINKWLNTDAERCSGTAVIDLTSKTAEEIAAIAGLNIQLGGVPAGAHMEITGIKFSPNFDTVVALDGTGVVGKTNPGSGDSVAATQTAAGIVFMADKNMAYVDFSAYLTANKIDLSDYATVSVAYRVVGSDGNVVSKNDEATYGKIALVESSKLNGYDSGINKWLSDFCSGTAVIDLTSKTTEEIAAIAGLNFQLGGVPAGAHMEITGIKFTKCYDKKIVLNSTGVVGKTNPGSGDSVAAIQTATSIEFMADKNMAYVDFSAYLTANKIDLSDYDAVEVTYQVVDSNGDVLSFNSSATYGKIALVESAKLNGYDSGINKWLNTDADRCSGTAVIDLTSKTAQEIAAIAGLNFQLGGVPAGAHMEITGIKLVYNA